MTGGKSQPIAPSAKERLGYPTQKPIKLLERIVKASSNEGDIVLDPFCGCATTCVVAETLGRKWVGIDVSHKAYELVKKRLTGEVKKLDPKLKNKEKPQIALLDLEKELHYTTTPPKRSDLGMDAGILKKYIYIISHPKYPGEYKVGIASDYKSRLNSYQTSDPDRKYKVEWKIKTPLFRKAEKHIHQTFENKHEWVQTDDWQKIKTEIERFLATSS